MSDRKVWFITRPERDPRFHADALEALAKATRSFTVKWSGNRVTHIAYEKALVEAQLKRENISNDGSGGRTWAAMLRTFAYCYIDQDGYIRLTKAGEKLLARDKVRQNITKQILTLQIPNAYFLEAGFKPKFEEGFKIRPARFLLRVVNQPALDYYVTKEEITFFVLTAKRDDEIEKVTERILKFRNASESEKGELKAEASGAYDHRERSDKLARDFEVAHGDVAHTFMMIAEYTGLAEYVRGKFLRVDPVKSLDLQKEMQSYEERYPFNARYKFSPMQMALNNGLDVDSYKAVSYGESGPATRNKKTGLLMKRLLKDIPDPAALPTQELVEILSNELSVDEAEKLAFEMKQVNFREISEDFINQYLNQENDRVFEDLTGKVLKAIGFEVIMRPKPVVKASTEIEILVKYGNEFCGIMDAKNYRPKFPLSANLVSHMASEYIPNYDGFDGRKVGFFGYVTADAYSGEKNLSKITSLSQRNIAGREIQGIILTAQTLLAFLDYCLQQQLPTEERVRMFLEAVSNEGYDSLEKMLKKVRPQ